MANFNFGHIGAAIEAGKSAAAHIDIGPINTLQYASDDNGFYNTTSIADRNATLNGPTNYFIWGHKWGNSKTRVVK